MKSLKKVARKKRVKKITNSTLKKHRAIKSFNATKLKRKEVEPEGSDHSAKDKPSKSDQAKNGGNVKTDSFRNEDADADSTNSGETQLI